MTELSGAITNYTKNGFESLNRDMLQDKNLSLEAIGLLANIISYPSQWKLHKTELYSRFPKNKRTSIDRIWEELLENGYIIQFRKRDGRKFTYQYLVSAFKFTKNDVVKIINNVSKKGYSFYHKSMLKVDDPSSINPIDFITVKDDKILASDGDKQGKKNYASPLNLQEIKEDVFSEDTTGEEGKSNEDNSDENSHKKDDTNVPRTVENEQSNVSSSNTTSNRLTGKRFTIHRFNSNSFKPLSDDDDNLYKQKVEKSNESDSDSKDLGQFLQDSPQLLELARVIFEAGAEVDDIYDILEYFKNSNQPVDSTAVEQQLNWMRIQARTEQGISSFSKYFIGGYEKRCSHVNIQAVYSFDGLKKATGETNELPYVPLYNWLEG